MRVRDRLVLTFLLVGGLLSLPSFFAAARLGDLRDLAVVERANHAEAALALGGGFENKSPTWVILFPVIDFGVIAASFRLRARSLLLLASLFLMIYVIKTTLQYFRDELGWPLALVLSGLALLVVGYLTYRLNRRVGSGRGAASGGD